MSARSRRTASWRARLPPSRAVATESRNCNCPARREPRPPVALHSSGCLQHEHTPQTWIFPERKVRAHAQHLLAQFVIADGVKKSKPRMLLGVVAVQHRG